MGANAGRIVERGERSMAQVTCAAPECPAAIDSDRSIGFAFGEPVPVSGIPGVQQG